jgi:hypothetical protein
MYAGELFPIDEPYSAALSSALARFPNPDLTPSHRQLSAIQRQTLAAIISSLSSVASQENVKHGRDWVLSQVSLSPDFAEPLARGFYDAVKTLPADTAYPHSLHVSRPCCC